MGAPKYTEYEFVSWLFTIIFVVKNEFMFKLLLIYYFIINLFFNINLIIILCYSE